MRLFQTKKPLYGKGDEQQSEETTNRMEEMQQIGTNLQRTSETTTGK